MKHLATISLLPPPSSRPAARRRTTSTTARPSSPTTARPTRARSRVFVDFDVRRHAAHRLVVERHADDPGPAALHGRPAERQQLGRPRRQGRDHQHREDDGRWQDRDQVQREAAGRVGQDATPSPRRTSSSCRSTSRARSDGVRRRSTSTTASTSARTTSTPARCSTTTARTHSGCTLAAADVDEGRRRR